MAKGVKTGGRMPGSPNKATAEFRDTVRQLLDKNSTNVSKWLAAVAQDDPGKALDLLTKLAEFAAPKLARTELTGAGGGPVQVAAIDASKLSEDQLRALSSIDIPDA